MAKNGTPTLEQAEKVIQKQREAQFKEMDQRSKRAIERVRKVLEEENCIMEVRMQGGPTPEQGVFAVQAAPFIRALPPRKEKMNVPDK